jgi:hypothetical protein
MQKKGRIKYVVVIDEYVIGYPYFEVCGEQILHDEGALENYIIDHKKKE